MTKSFAFVVSFSVIFFSTQVAALTHSEMNYATELEAVRAASNRYNPLSIRDDQEYMGAIVKTGDGYCFTVDQGKKYSNRISISIPVEQWDNVVAFWHTHGSDWSQHRYFSDVDTRTAEKFGLPFYMADYTGFLKVYRPGDKLLRKETAQRLGLPPRRGYAIGEFVKDIQKRSVQVSTLMSDIHS